LFRNKRKRALEKLQQAGGKSLENEFLDDKELDVDAFFDVK
jgi:hypothetical protein